MLAPTESDIDSEHDNVATAIEQRQQPGAAAMPRSESPLDLGLRDASDSLREMAERVGKEVETFAERLDEFLDSLPKSDTYEAVLGLVDEYQSIAKDAAYKLDAEHRRDRAHVLRQEWSETAQVASAAPTNALAAPAYLSSAESIGAARREKVVQQRKWQQEADIWDLFRLMLELHHNPDKRAQKRERDSRLADLGNVHRYTSEAELWDRFLLTDDVARERDLVRRWLEQTVEHQASDVTGIAEELETKAGRGKGLWSHGWMHTRETIKHEKRLRAWPEPDALPLPTLRRKDNNEALVTSLDPDAASRQNRALEQADAFAERALWITCWEMLRRGRSWQEVSEWCEQHHEPWRASVIGKSSDPTDVTSNAVWRRMCYLASQSDSCSDFEAAVYLSLIHI